MERPEPLDERIASVAALEQPLRRDLFRLLGDGWLTRDDAAAALDVPRSVAAFHLDRLVQAGVAEVSYARPEGRSGPGAGRPAKRYRRRREEVAAAVPDRHYDLAGSLLAAAVADSVATGTPVEAALADAARAAGREVGADVADDGGSDAVVAALSAHGYEPLVTDDGEIALANCPFHRLAEEHRSLVCGMNLDFLAGVLDGAGSADLHARLQPEPGRCCVRISAGQGGGR